MQLLYTKRKCRNHGFLLAFFGDFLSLLKESHPSETKEERAAGGTFLTQKGLLKESHPRIPQKNTPSPSRIHSHRDNAEGSHVHAQDRAQSQDAGR